MTDDERRERLSVFTDQDLRIEMSDRRRKKMVWAEGRDRIMLRAFALGFSDIPLTSLQAIELDRHLRDAIMDADAGVF